jgi:formate/nitrite transporter FocA (FNT family)
MIDYWLQQTEGAKILIVLLITVLFILIWCSVEMVANFLDHEITIYMKSGNSIRIKHLKNVTYTYKGNMVTALSLRYRWYGRERLMLGATDLSQIETIIKH